MSLAPGYRKRLHLPLLKNDGSTRRALLVHRNAAAILAVSNKVGIIKKPRALKVTLSV